MPQSATPARAAKPAPRRPRGVRLGSAVVALVAACMVGAATWPTPAAGARVRGADNAVAARGWLDSLRGQSRKLRARFISPKRLATVPMLRALFGDSLDVPRAERVVAEAGADTGPFRFLRLRPFEDKVAGRIGAYRIGFFPAEQRAVRSAAYANPDGFLEVTPGNQETALSEHFRLRDFLTHDQGDIWPKYLVLREPLIDKLELVIDELQRVGVPVQRLRVMSGFRTPQYNAQGVGPGGRVQDSRHQFGDAADVYVVNGTRDWMSDLDGDGRITVRDARVVAQAAERVERAHPDLVGGIGVYLATDAHGPFVHIDVRGNRARWGAL